MAIINRLGYQYGGLSYLIKDDASIAEWEARSGFLDLSSTASDPDNAARIAQAQLTRSSQPTKARKATVEMRGGDEPIIDFHLFGTASAPDQSDTVDGLDSYEVQTINFGVDVNGRAIVGVELGDRRVLQAELDRAALDRAARGTLNAQNKQAGSSLVPDEFTDFATGVVQPTQGPDFSKPDSILVGSSGHWSPQQRARIVQYRISSDLSGGSDTVIEFKRGVVGSTAAPVSFSPTPLIVHLIAGAVFTQGIIFNQLFQPSEYCVVQVTAAGGHTQVHIQTDAAPAI